MVMRFRFNHGVPPVSVEEWGKIARRKLPGMSLSYLEGGADDLLTVEENIAAFKRWRLRAMQLTGVTNPDLSATIAGTRISIPVACAPTGAAGLSHWSADVAVARAAEKAGTRLCLSGASSYKIEEVAEATEQNHWFQLYPFSTPERVAELIARAKAAGYTALFVTVDVPTLGNREGERRWHMQPPWTVTPPRALHLMKHWRWVRDALVRKRIGGAHFLEEDFGKPQSSGVMAGVAEAMKSQANMQRQMMQADLSWDDMKWFRDQWDGPMYIKGILDPDDAARAVDEIGCQGVVVSNHGGRQLERCLAPCDALPAIVDRIGDRADVYLDGGVRRGTDVITAIALGAKAVFVGRPYLYGLAANGEAGVSSILEIFREEIKRALILMGCPSIEALDRSWLIRACPSPLGALTK
jgi:isopentenyl diphosphate isomerase/L-lactate dehydrogenase-like FMN-dependent dehydrogenase